MASDWSVDMTSPRCGPRSLGSSKGLGLRCRFCKVDFVLSREFVVFAGGTILKFEFMNIVDELAVIRNREFQVVVGVRFCGKGKRFAFTTGHLQVPCAVVRVRFVLTCWCGDAPTGLAVQTPEGSERLLLSTSVGVMK